MRGRSLARQKDRALGRRPALLPLVGAASLAALLGMGPVSLPAFAEEASSAPPPEGVEEIAVIGTRTERPVFLTPAAVTTIDQETLSREQASSFADVFEGTPGVSVQGGARRIAEEPNIRGFDDEQLVIRVNGARQNFNLAHSGRFFADPDLLERVEVLRGPGSSLYGSGALGGVIELRTRSARDLLADDGSIGGRYKFGYSSNGREVLHSATAAARGFGFDLLTAFTWRDMDKDLEDGAGAPIFATRDDVTSREIKLGFSPTEEHRFELSTSLYQNDGVEPPAADGVADPTNLVRRDTEHSTWQLDYAFQSASHDLLDLHARIYRNDLDTSEFRFTDPRFDTSEYQTLGAEIYNTALLELSPDTDLRLVTGLEAYRDDQQGTRDGADRRQFPDAEVRYLAGYFQGELTLGERWSIVPGLRYDRFDSEAENFDDTSSDRLSPRLAIGYALTPDLYLWASGARSFRAPSLTERFADGVHFAVPGGAGPGSIVINEFQPTPGLAPERARTFEGGLRWRWLDPTRESRFQVEATVFDARVEDYVDVAVAFISGPPSFDPPSGTLIFPGTTTNLSVDARLRGIEALLRWDTAWTSTQLSGFALSTENLESGNELDSTPANAVFASFTVHPPALPLAFGARASVTRRQTGGSTETDGHTVVDLFAQYTPRSGPLEGVTLTAAINNLLDEEYAVHPSVLNQPGRSLRLGLAYSFGLQGL